MEKLGKVLKTAFSVMPALVVGWASKWAGVFEGSLFLPDADSGPTMTTGVTIGSILAVICALLFHNASRRSLVFAAGGFTLLTIAIGFGCSKLRESLTYPMSRELREFLLYWWPWLSSVLIASALLAILFATMAAVAGGSKPATANP